MPDEALNRLKGLRQQGRLIPFVGSGLSKPLGLPDLSALIDIIAEQLEYDPQVFKLNGTELQLTEYYVANKRSIGPLRSEMDRLFNPSDDQIKKSRAHRALVEMKLPLIYTTNYDRIIERAFDIRKEPCHTIANLDDIGQTRKRRLRTYSRRSARTLRRTGVAAPLDSDPVGDRWEAAVTESP